MRVHSGKDVKQIIAKLNPVLRGWGNYFRTGNADRKFIKLDSYVYGVCPLDGSAGRAAEEVGWRTWTDDQFCGNGSVSTARNREIPGASHTRRSSLSRVRENRTHGLKGVC